MQTNLTTNSLVVTFDASTLSLPQVLEGLHTSAGISEAATLVNNGSTVVAGLNGLRPLLSEQLDQLAASLDTNGNDQDSETSQILEEVTNGSSSQQPTSELLESLEEPLETSLNNSISVISEPPNTLETTQAVSDSLEVPTEPLTAKALAHRLNVSATTISKRKSKPDFPE